MVDITTIQLFCRCLMVPLAFILIVAIWLFWQELTDQQYPQRVVARLLDSPRISLQPFGYDHSKKQMLFLIGVPYNLDSLDHFYNGQKTR